MRLFLKILAGAAALGVVVFCWARLPLADAPADSRAAELLRPGPVAVKVWETTIEDPSRPTAPHHNFAGAPTRKLTLRVWQPVLAGEPGPLVVYSHGFGGDRDDIEYLTWQLASLGYVVIAPSFPSTSTFAPGGPLVTDVVNQPGDLRFIIDQALGWNRLSGHALFARIDPERIGAMGISLGGLTTTLLAFDSAHRDDRLKAAVSIVGLHAMFTPAFYAERSLPYLEIAGTDDEVVPYASNGALVATDVPGAVLVSVEHGSHSGFVQLFRYLRFLSHPDAVACAFIRRSIDQKVIEWPAALSAQTIGIRDVESHSCQGNRTDRAIDPRAQQRVASVAVRAFFESRFSPSEARRADLAAYLRHGLARELPGVRVDVTP